MSEIICRLANFIHDPVSGSSLGVVRALFGLMMIFDVPHERGLHDLKERYGDPYSCHFPLFHWWTPPSFENIGILYLIMWTGAFGICLGLKFKTSCLMFAVPYWYIFLLDKTAWNNHSYLYGLLSGLLLFSNANYNFSLDSWLDPKLSQKKVPRWNYWIIRFQLFVLYFYAGLKKMDPDWLGGHSMRISPHWVFDPFRILLTNDQIDFWVVHTFGFAFDLTVGFWLLWETSRPYAIVFTTSFHVMNSRMFQIGQFPYVCLVTTPIFCDYSWPERLYQFLKSYVKKAPSEEVSSATPTKSKRGKNNTGKLTWKKKLSTASMTAYVILQLFLPYSHWLTKGYNNWTNGLYGYSWDMMVHSWDTTLITVTVKGLDTGQHYYLDPNVWVRNTRYSKHADMQIQYAACVERNMQLLAEKDNGDRKNFSVYMDVWSSLNKRFQQRMIDPKQDLLKADWHPLQTTKWMMPLLSELTTWRGYIEQMHEAVQQQDNRSDCLFVADFPGMKMEHYIHEELENVSIRVLQGSITVGKGKVLKTLNVSDYTAIESGNFHQVTTTSEVPACFVYTFQNVTNSNLVLKKQPEVFAGLEIFNGLNLRYHHFVKSIETLQHCLAIWLEKAVVIYSDLCLK